MNIQEFCINHKLPITRVSRLIRGQVQEILDETSAVSGEGSAAGDIDFTLASYGVSVSRGAGEARFKYHITDQKLLYRSILQLTNYEVMRPEQIHTLIDAATRAFDVYTGRDEEYTLVDFDGDKVEYDMKYWGEVRKALEWVGGLSDPFVLRQAFRIVSGRSV